VPYKDPETRRKKQIEATRRYRQRHPEKIRAMHRAYYWKNHQRMLVKMKESHQRLSSLRHWYRQDYNHRLKQSVIQAYGGQCACCGETELCFLCIDHIGGGGTKHRESTGKGHRFYEWLRRQGYPPGYQVLCYNCNAAKESPGGCPHKKNGSKTRQVNIIALTTPPAREIPQGMLFIDGDPDHA